MSLRSLQTTPIAQSNDDFTFPGRLPQQHSQTMISLSLQTTPIAQSNDDLRSLQTTSITQSNDDLRSLQTTSITQSNDDFTFPADYPNNTVKR